MLMWTWKRYAEIIAYSLVSGVIFALVFRYLAAHNFGYIESVIVAILVSFLSTFPVSFMMRKIFPSLNPSVK